MHTRNWLGGLAALGMLAAQAPAGQVVVEASKDNTLFEHAQGELSNGIGEYMFVGQTAVGLIRRAVIAFDVAGAVPEGATIESVELSLVLTMTIAAPQNVDLHRLTADWGEGTSNSKVMGGGMGAQATAGDATWQHTFYPDSFWANDGGDFAAEPSGSTTVAGKEGVGLPQVWSSSEGMVADVQSWLDDPAGNFGWILIGNELTFGSAKRFDTHETTVPGNEPKLTIEYSLGGVPGDATGDGVVNVQDITEVILAWGPCPSPPDPCPADFNDDGIVDVQDLTTVILNWS